MLPRKGTRANPFKLGERVRERTTYLEGEVVEIGGVFNRRTFNSYLVWFDNSDQKKWIESTQLEVVE